LRRIAISLFLIAALACSNSASKRDQYRIEKADRGDITATVTATGTLSAVTTVLVGSQVSGVIARLFVNFNSRVRKGQLLAELDPTPFQQQAEGRQADLTKAQVEAANAKINFERQARLVKAGLAAQAEYDSTKAQYDAARAQVQQANAALSQARTNLRYTHIVSPIDGIVVDRQYDVGQTVAASFQAPTLFSIAQDLTKMQVQADVDQSDIGRVKVGQPARFTVDAYPDQEFSGRISQIRLNATVTQNVVTYPVIIEVPNPEEKLRPKMTANVIIDVAMIRDALRIPNAAVRFKPDMGEAGSGQRVAGGTGGSGGTGERGLIAFGRGQGAAGASGMLGATMQQPAKKQTIYLLEPDGKLKAVPVQTGISDGHHTQIVEGNLKPGDSVVVGLVTSKVESAPPPGGGRGPMGGPGRGPR
jgi:HlyD family secretion protein